MATKDGFQPDRSPIFLSEHAEETEQPDIGKAWDIATISSRILKTSILAVTVTAIGIAILSIGNPVALVANVTDWWVDKPALQPEADPSTSTIQSIASTQDLPPTTTDTPTRDEIAAAVEPADQSQVEVGQSQASQSQTLFFYKNVKISFSPNIQITPSSAISGETLNQSNYLVAILKTSISALTATAIAIADSVDGRSVRAP